jgi:ribosomal protein L32
VLTIVRRERHEVEDAARESPFAASSEGMKRCPNCGTANLVTDTTCSNCGKHLPG